MLRIERHAVDLDPPTQRLEHGTHESLATSRGDGGDARLERDGRLRKSVSLLTVAGEGSPVHARERDGEERTRDIRAIAHIGSDWRVPAAAHERNRVNLEEQSRGARAILRARVENVRAPERQVARMGQPRRLVQEVAEVGRRRVSCRDREQHNAANDGTRRRVQSRHSTPDRHPLARAATDDVAELPATVACVSDSG